MDCLHGVVLSSSIPSYTGLYLDESDVRGIPPSAGPSKHTGASDSSATSLERIVGS